ncbi:DUF4442 domain-containing protein [Nonomuraea sp. NBC_01738]|uniref:DUF4442 domain-containing protein n=1 Tax=Nonomuraea sp. NBC_01738 TaxID=2976003 RepID=UPI002E0D0EFA|nr:DUF4442 domain-containing protein [Nonomuraea sp. NBC_01738]
MSFDVGEFLLQSVPFARELGITFDKVSKGVAICRLPDRPELHNHVGGPHAGALFTLAESASGAATLSLFGSELSRAVPLVTTSTVTYRKLAMGEIVAEAHLDASREEVLAELDAGRRPEFRVTVTLTNADGLTVSDLTVTWTLRPTA